jgi:hypothetical protein
MQNHTKMKKNQIYILLINLFLLSCHNKEENEIIKLAKKNNELLDIINQNNNNEFDNLKEDNYFELVKIIEDWQIKSIKIDSLIKIYSKGNGVDVKNLNQLYTKEKDLNNQIQKIITEKVENLKLHEYFKKDIPSLNKNDSSRLDFIIKSRFSDSTKTYLLENYYKNKYSNYLAYIVENTPRRIKCLNYERNSSIAIANKSIVLPGEEISISRSWEFF